MNDSPLRFEFEDGLAQITLDRPQKRNALSQVMIEGMLQSVRATTSEETARLLVLAAEGPVFCAGMDLGEMQDRAGRPNAAELWQRDARLYRDLLVGLLELPVPTVAVVQGPGLAGGLGLVLACDIVLAAEDAFFALPEPKRGITAAVVTPLLVHRIGPGPADYVLLSGERLSAEDAHRWGLCHRLVPGEHLEERRRELTESILEGAPGALAMTKRFLLESAFPDSVQQMDAAMRLSAEARETDEAREGLQAFLEKRRPQWGP